MANGTNPMTNYGQIISFAVHTFTGVTISLSNLVIIVCVLWFRALRTRKEFVLLLMLAVADAINHSNKVPANIYRTWLVLSGGLRTRVTPLNCLLKPHMFVWLFGNQLASAMLVVTSSDRLLLVLYPYKYLKLTTRYAYRVAGVAYTFTILMAVVGSAFILTNDQRPSEQALCGVTPSLLGASKSRWRALYAFYSFKCAPLLAFVSVVVYLCIYPVNRMRKAKIVALGVHVDVKVELARQRSLTKHLAICCVCTFFLYCVPIYLAHFYKNKRMFTEANVFFFITSLNSFSNLVIYQWKIPEMRMALKYMLQGKSLPGNIKLWPKANGTKTIKKQAHQVDTGQNNLDAQNRV